MNYKTLALGVLSILAFSPSSEALELKILKHYDEASNEGIWDKTKTDQIPEILLGNEQMGTPRSAYASVFPKAFLQEELFAVCYQNCNQKDKLKMIDKEIQNLKDWDVIEQTNVYFWLNQYFKFLQSELQFQPELYLKVFTNREFRENGKLITNNAFFNPQDISLSFLPATKNILFKLLDGKISRSGYDPSVIIHEASHYIFHHIYPNSINNEIGGLNEGFADYMANIFLSNPKVGIVMLHGKALRDSSHLVDSKMKMKTYEPRMEVHQLGERVAYALWTTREMTYDKHQFDRLVIDSIYSLNESPYNAIHHFKNNILMRLPSVLNSMELANANKLWEDTFPGEANSITNFDFLRSDSTLNKTISFKIKHVIPKEIAEEVGVPEITDLSYGIVRTVNISSEQQATLMIKELNGTVYPYWIAVDKKRSNILGIYALDRSLVTDPKELKMVKDLADQALGTNEMSSDFNKKIEDFTNFYFKKGPYSLFYKRKSTEVTNTIINFNGQGVDGKLIEMKVKKNFKGHLAGFLLNLPEVASISLFTIPGKVGSFEVEGQSVIGYALKLKNGMTTEFVMNYNMN